MILDAGAHLAALAALWRDAALAEHASIASFSRSAMELLAVGAPLSLVKRMHEAALDEIRHTEISFAVATALDGQHFDAGPLPALPPRAATIERVAVDTFVEAAVPETIAAQIAARAAAECTDVTLAGLVRSIAADEARHAELAWDILAWCDVPLNIDVPAPSLPPAAPVAGFGLLTQSTLVDVGTAALTGIRSRWQPRRTR